MTMHAPLIAIGLDAADPELVDGYIADGTMPVLAGLRARGTHGRLAGADVYRAETPWTNFLTGCRAESSGYWGPIRYNPQTYLTDEAGAYAFDRLPPFYTAVDGPVCVFDVPQTRLQPALDGIQVLGWGSHSQQGPACSLPPGLLDELEARFGVSPVDDETATNAYDPDALDAFNADVVEALRRRGPLSAALLLQQDWRMFLTVLGEPHSGGHELWHHGEPHPLQRPGVERIRDLYRATDAVIGQILQAAPAQAHTVVFSLHGMVPNKLDVPSMAILPEVLARWAFGRAFVADGVDPPPQPRRDFARHWKHEIWQLRTAAGEAELEGPDRLRERGDVLNWQPAQWYRPLWPRMRAFALPSYSDGTIRFNLRGRERDGRVEPADVAALAQELSDLLAGLIDLRSGRPVVERVIHRQVRPGESPAPADLVVHWSDAALSDVFAHPALGVFGPYPWFRTGGHRPVGFWTAVGPRIQSGRNADGGLLDLPATLLDLAGCAPHPWMEGRSLLDEG